MIFSNNKHAFYMFSFDSFMELTWLTSNIISMVTAPPYDSTCPKPEPPRRQIEF